MQQAVLTGNLIPVSSPRVSGPFIEQGSSSCSQGHIIAPHPLPDESSPHPQTQYFRDYLCTDYC